MCICQWNSTIEFVSTLKVSKDRTALCHANDQSNFWLMVIVAAALAATMSINGTMQREREVFMAKYERAIKFEKCIWTLPFRGEWRVARHRLWRHVGLHVAIEKGFATLGHILLQNESRSRWRNGPVRRQWTTAPTAARLLLWSTILNVKTGNK